MWKVYVWKHKEQTNKKRITKQKAYLYFWSLNENLIFQLQITNFSPDKWIIFLNPLTADYLLECLKVNIKFTHWASITTSIYRKKTPYQRCLDARIWLGWRTKSKSFEVMLFQNWETDISSITQHNFRQSIHCKKNIYMLL